MLLQNLVSFAMRTLCYLLALSFTLANAREMRDLTNREGTVIKAEILELTAEGMVKVVVKLKPYEIPLASLSDEDQAWLKQWDLTQRLGEEAAYYSEEIFTDDFAAEGFGERWGHYKSGSVVRDGVLVGITPEGSDHSAVESIRLEGRQDVQVRVRFRFVGTEGKSFNVWLDDKDYKASHAGHICSISISPENLTIADAKTGAFENSIYEQKKSGAPLSKELEEMLATKNARFPLELARDEWHSLIIRSKGDTTTVLINDKEAGEFSSEGIQHETKSLISLTTNAVGVEYDDFSIHAAMPQ